MPVCLKQDTKEVLGITFFSVKDMHPDMRMGYSGATDEEYFAIISETKVLFYSPANSENNPNDYDIIVEEFTDTEKDGLDADFRTWRVPKWESQM